jgi:hypothetical protein
MLNTDVNVPQNAFGFAYGLCNTGESAVGGGADWTGENNSNGNAAAIAKSFPFTSSGIDGWTVYLTSSAAGGATHLDVTVYVECQAP